MTTKKVDSYPLFKGEYVAGDKERIVLDGEFTLVDLWKMVSMLEDDIEFTWEAK
jgi:hypothetical protein